MPKQARWHKKVKEVLEEIGRKKGYDVSESEKEVILASKFQMYDGERRKIHTILYKPDVVWKKRQIYRAVFEIEYVNPLKGSQVMDKRKYSIGSLMLAYMMMMKKSVRRTVVITNCKDLCSNIGCFVQLTPLKYSKETILYLYEPNTTRSGLYKSLEETLIDDWKL